MTLTRLARSNLTRRPARTILTGMALAVALAAIVTLTGLSRGLDRAFTDAFVRRGSDVLVARAGTVDMLGATLEEELADALAHTPGVSAVAGELIDVIEADDGRSLMVAGWPAGAYLWQAVPVIDGRVPQPAEDDGVLLGDLAARALGARVGGRVWVGGRPWVVTGVFDGGGTLSSMMAVVALPALQEVLGRPGMVTVLHLRLDGAGDRAVAEATRQRLVEAHPGLRFRFARDLARESRTYGHVRWASRVIAAITGVIAMLVVANTFLLSVTERRREIGILRAVGWSGRRIMGLVLLEGVLLACGGGLAGVAVGWASLVAVASSPALAGFVSPWPDAATLALALASAVLIGLGGSAYPAWRAARAMPVASLQAR